MDELAMLSLQEEDEEPPGKPAILVIYSVVEALERGETVDLVTDQETAWTAHAVAEGLRACGFKVSLASIRSEEDLLVTLRGVERHSTLVFNLCEALGGDSSGEARVPALLDELGYQYTGANAATLLACLDKAFTKLTLRRRGLPTPPCQVFHRSGGLVRVPFPAIVKPLLENCSLGITRDSVVEDEPALRRQVEYILEVYKQPALVEQFIDGREFNVSVWGNHVVSVLPISEIDYSSWAERRLRVLNFDAKWNPDSPEYQTMAVLCPSPVQEPLAQRIRRVALAAYKVMRCRDYGRVDLREKDGVPYVLDVNPNPCLAQDGGFANSARAAGLSYPMLVGRIAALAWMRRPAAWSQRRKTLYQGGEVSYPLPGI